VLSVRVLYVVFLISLACQLSHSHCFFAVASRFSPLCRKVEGRVFTFLEEHTFEHPVKPTKRTWHIGVDSKKGKVAVARHGAVLFGCVVGALTRSRALFFLELLTMFFARCCMQELGATGTPTTLSACSSRSRRSAPLSSGIKRSRQ
jgi:hypothetical protein